MLRIRYRLLAKSWLSSLGKSEARAVLQLHELENRILPAEAHFLFRLFGVPGLARISPWMGKSSTFAARFKRASVQFGNLRKLSYEARPISEHLTFFKRQGSKGTVIVFGGLMGRPGLPTWRFLAAMHPAEMSFLVIHEKGSYKAGVTGLGKDPVELMTTLRSIAKRLDLRLVGTFGVSAGSLPAVYFSNQQRLPTIVVGPTNPTRSTSWEILLASEPLRHPERLVGRVIAGSEVARDLVFAKLLNSIFPQLKTTVVDEGGHIPIEVMGLEQLRKMFEEMFIPIDEVPKL